jgi:hypothetical protein
MVLDQYFKKWIKTFYCDISSAFEQCTQVRVLHFGEEVRQVNIYPLFIYFNLLSSTIKKNDPNINGVKINDSEFLLSQYADD